MTRPVDVLASIDLTPEQMAALFWAMDANEHADFFAALERMAGYRLCMQMAGVVDVIQERAGRGDYDAMQGFQTMLSHAQAYAESAASYRANDARIAINRMVRDAQVNP